MTLDVVLATFSVVQLVLSLGAALIAISLRKTFEGGIFERAWRIIAVAPVIYGVGQALGLAQAISEKTPIIESVESLFEVLFLVMLVFGFFMFASAWSSKPRDQREEGYSKKAKGALVFFMGNSGASVVLLYTGEPKAEDFEAKLKGVVGSGASTMIQRVIETSAPPSEEEKSSRNGSTVAPWT